MYFQLRNKVAKSYRGSAIIETLVGLFVLMPVFLLLVDVLALVIAQTMNDDLAKQAARYAAQQDNEPDADTIANNYVSGMRFAKNKSGIVTGAQLISLHWDKTNEQVTVTTQITCNLPVPVPLGGPSSQVMKAQASEPIVGIQPKPPSS